MAEESSPKNPTPDEVIDNPLHVELANYFETESLPNNERPSDGYFGELFRMMRMALVSGGSEFGLGMTLFSLTVSTQAERIIEIGRFKGFATLCLASGLKFIDEGWDEPKQHKQRPDVDYAELEKPRQRTLHSIDPYPTQEAYDIVRQAGLESYVEFINKRSDEAEVEGLFDIIFIDGEHTVDGCAADVAKFVPNHLRPGGYFILHDYYGWFDENNKSQAGVKKVADQIASKGIFQHLLIDTKYMSFVIFRRPHPDLDD